MTIIELQSSRLEEAFEIFKASYCRQREFVPVLEEENARPDLVLPMLEGCLKKHRGVAVYDHEKMVGYMTGFYIEEFLSPHKGVYSPEWAHGSVEESAFDIYRLMYRKIGQIWADDGCLTHAANTMNYAGSAREAFFWNGFGGICIDAVREVKPLAAKRQEGLRIESIKEEDLPEWLAMVEGHYYHLANAPVFKPYHAQEKQTVEALAELLARPGNHAWIARVGDSAAGYMKIAPSEDGAGWMVGGRARFAVNGAFVYPGFRGRGIAGALLDEIMIWGAEQGMQRCSVDFEATNIEACHFWLRYFQPVCRSVVRRLDANLSRGLRPE
jgi:GNAT superfamily N-acetyltransferase